MEALVIPSIREHHLFGFLEAWKNINVHFFIIEDNPTKTFNDARIKDIIGEEYTHFSWKEIKDTLGDDDWVISHRDSAIRSFGFLMAHRFGFHYIYTLDDDCMPIGDPNQFIDDHQNAIYNHPKWTQSYSDTRTRGLPYKNIGLLRNIVLNMGFWTGIPDLDSIQTLSEFQWEDKKLNTKIMPSGQYFPLCGMNLCFKEEIAPLMYFPLMGEGYPYRRFDDIWCGIIMKKICDHLGLFVTCGPPYIDHRRASDPFVNLVKEAPGIAMNENFWKIIDDIELKGNDCLSCMYDIGCGLREEKDEYLSKLGQAIDIWTTLF